MQRKGVTIAPLKGSSWHCHSYLTGQPTREHPWMESEWPLPMGHPSPHGNQTLADEDMSIVPETAVSETDSRNHARNSSLF